MSARGCKTRPRLLDLFCGAGGAAMGYHRAGFDVVGVDNRRQPRYPFEFVQADAMTFPLDGFDAVHASPPCQLFSEGAPGRKRDGHPDLLAPIRERLRAWGGCYVIENVATAPMGDNILLCGASFGLPLIRHRRFEVHPDPGLMPSLCPQRRFARGVDHGPGFYPYGHGNWGPAWRKHVLLAVWPWMTVTESGQAIPPAYTEYIGAQLMDHLKQAAA